MPRLSHPEKKTDYEITTTDTIELGVLSNPNDNSTEHKTQTDLVAAPGEPATCRHLSGRRLYILIFGLCLSLLLSTLETTIVSTSLVSITNALSGFEDRDWVVTSYLLTYTGNIMFSFHFKCHIRVVGLC
jgi:hypothetical protein